MAKLQKTIVVKIGSSVLADAAGAVNEKHIATICRALADVQRLGYAPVVVLSGAVSTGKQDGGLTLRQSQASRGQWRLNALFEMAGQALGLRFSLALLTRQDIANRKRYTALHETLHDLLSHGAIPVVNENDAVGAGDISDFPDNDHLAAVVALALGAERLFLLTNVDGLYSGNPNKEKAVTLLEEITNVNKPLLAIARGKQSDLGRGGMVGKLRAARLATAVGVPVHIFNGVHPEYLGAILEGKQHGTLCRSRAHNALALSMRDRWMLSAQNTGASIVIDRGAVEALKKRKSLLAVGAKEMFGAFTKREVIEVLDEDKETVAVGLTEIASDDLAPLLASRNKSHGVEVIHANNLILL
ncbi:glutamate 5-kinase [Candidatus Uhrbacteria bacterium]|nr:glutamate 5-kinase [Candidatus Uhrbacteria bacterium]